MHILILFPITALLLVTVPRIIIHDLGEQGNKDEIRRLYGRFGHVKNVWVADNPPGFAYVFYYDMGDAREAVDATNGRFVCGCKVRVALSPIEEKRPRDDVYSKMRPMNHHPMRGRSPPVPRGRSSYRGRSMSPPRSRGHYESRDNMHSSRSRVPPPPPPQMSRGRYPDSGHQTSRHATSTRILGPRPPSFDESSHGRDRYSNRGYDYGRNHSDSHSRPQMDSSGYSPKERSRHSMESMRGPPRNGNVPHRRDYPPRVSRDNMIEHHSRGFSDRERRHDSGRPPMPRSRSLRKHGEYDPPYPTHHHFSPPSPRRMSPSPPRFGRSMRMSDTHLRSHHNKDMEYRDRSTEIRKMRPIREPISAGRKLHHPSMSSSYRSSRSEHPHQERGRDRGREEQRRNWEENFRDRSPIRHHSSSRSEHRSEGRSYRQHRPEKEHHYSDGQSPSYHSFDRKSPQFSNPGTYYGEWVNTSYYQINSFSEDDYQGRSPSHSPIEFVDNQEDFTIQHENYEFDPPPDSEQYLQIDEVKDEHQSNEFNEPSDRHMYAERDILFSPPHEREIIHQENEREVIAHSPDKERLVFSFA